MSFGTMSFGIAPFGSFYSDKRVAVSKTFGFQWSAVEAVVKEFSVLWASAEIQGKPFAFNWSSYEVVGGKDGIKFGFQWQAKELVGNTLTLAWGTERPLSVTVPVDKCKNKETMKSKTPKRVSVCNPNNIYRGNQCR